MAIFPVDLLGMEPLVLTLASGKTVAVGVGSLIDMKSIPAFWRNVVASVTIPVKVTTIGEWAFSGCTSLASVTIPEGVTTIGKFAFYGCTSLASVTIPGG